MPFSTNLLYIDHVPVPGAPLGNTTLCGTGTSRHGRIGAWERCTRGGGRGGYLEAWFNGGMVNGDMANLKANLRLI